MVVGAAEGRRRGPIRRAGTVTGVPRTEHPRRLGDHADGARRLPRRVLRVVHRARVRGHDRTSGSGCVRPPVRCPRPGPCGVCTSPRCRQASQVRHPPEWAVCSTWWWTSGSARRPYGRWDGLILDAVDRRSVYLAEGLARVPGTAGFLLPSCTSVRSPTPLPARRSPQPTRRSALTGRCRPSNSCCPTATASPRHWPRCSGRSLAGMVADTDLHRPAGSVKRRLHRQNPHY